MKKPKGPEASEAHNTNKLHDHLLREASRRKSTNLKVEACVCVGGEGERTEAHFYEGVRQLGSDQAAARALFERVLQTEMVSFYEYAMAQALLRQLGDGAPSPAAN